MEMLLGVSFLKQSHEMHILFVVLKLFGHHMDGWHILFVVLTIYTALASYMHGLGYLSLVPVRFSYGN
jgi:hypothetical protein